MLYQPHDPRTTATSAIPKTLMLDMDAAGAGPKALRCLLYLREVPPTRCSAVCRRGDPQNSRKGSLYILHGHLGTKATLGIQQSREKVLICPSWQASSSARDAQARQNRASRRFGSTLLLWTCYGATTSMARQWLELVLSPGFSFSFKQ